MSEKLEAMSREVAEGRRKPISVRSTPANSIIYPDGGMFSSWGEDLALVYTTTFTDERIAAGRFRPERMERLYVVRRTYFKGTQRTIKATDKYVGEAPIVSPDDESIFAVGRLKDGRRELTGAFQEPEFFWVRQRISELFPAEVTIMKEYLDQRGVLDVSNLNLTGSDWRMAFGGSFADTQNLPPVRADEFKKALVKSMNGCPRDSEHAELLWAHLKKKGVYGLAKRQDILKFIL